MKSWKIEKFFGDIVYDLRSRGLLPVAILLAVGMLAVPFVITRSGSDSEAGPAAATPAASELAPENQPAVLAYNPGVRNYKERLEGLASKDPFVQQFTTPEPGTTSLEQSGTGIEQSGGGGAGGGVTTGGSTGSTGSKGSGGSGKGGVRYFYYLTDVLVGEVGTEPKRKNGVDPFDYLPGKSAPVLVFMGNQSDKSAVFLVSKDVLSQEGAGVCFPSPDSCQLLELREGESQELVYGIDSKTYRIKVLNVKLKISRKPPS